ncbi:MAG: hypothetical protein SVK54_08155, partial [candidate division WOR-3 bacterium]|nr:hypothetical protein [candidate division WOR-3 bacterium]
MKFIHYVNNYEERGGKALFVRELAQDETILTMNNKAEGGNAVEVSQSDFAQHVNESEADTLILHDIIDITADMLESIENRSVITIIHDYYPVCERYTLINNRNNLCSGPYANNCIYCYIYKFPIIKFFHRNTQNMLIPLIKPLSPTMKYYSSRLENKRKVMDKIDSIVFPTEKSRKILMRFFKSGKEKAVVLPHFQQELSCSRKKQDKPVFAFIGHDAYHKGFYILEEALEKLTNKHIRV